MMKSTWPSLSYSGAKETYTTLHLGTQILGKIKLAKMPWINHSWHVTLFVTPFGLTTSSMPAENQHFQIDFDFVRHLLTIATSTKQTRQILLKQMPVAEFYEQIMYALSDLGIRVKINLIPNELENPVPFDQDHIHSSYHPGQIEDLHQVLLHTHEVFTLFRSKFIGKCSPVHLFWGGFDLAVSRFSGHKAPKHPGGIPNMPDWVAQEAYSHEVSSCGFWPGNDAVPYPLFYAYIYPEPAGFNKAKIEPAEAFYHEELREFILPYEIVQQSNNPEQTLTNFLQTTYNAAADLANWDRKASEKETSIQ